jgi:hypothetical protein
MEILNCIEVEILKPKDLLDTIVVFLATASTRGARSDCLIVEG